MWSHHITVWISLVLKLECYRINILSDIFTSCFDFSCSVRAYKTAPPQGKWRYQGRCCSFVIDFNGCETNPQITPLFSQ